MRIAIFDMDSLKNPFWASGQAIATYEISKRLAKKHSVTIYTSKYKGYKDYVEDRVSYTHIGVNFNNAKINNIFYILTVPIYTFFIHTDLIIEHFTAPFSVCFTPLFTKKKVIAITSFFGSTEISNKYKINFTFVRNIGLKLYKNIIVLNKHQEKEIKKLNENVNCQLIYNGVSDELFKYKHRLNKQNYVLYIGRLDIYGKGIDLLLESFSKIANEIKEDLYIMGKGALKEENAVKFLIKQFHLQKKVHLLPFKTGKEKLDIMAGAKFTIFSSRFEGNSIASLESLTLGVPFICFDIPGFKYANSKISIKAPPFNTNKMATSIKKLSLDRKLRKELSIEAIAQAQKYKWDTVVKHYLSFIQSL